MIIIFNIVRSVKYFLTAKYLKARHLFQINSSEIKLFNKDVFKGKNIIIIGPASSAMSYMSGENIDKFDFIIRINKSPLMLEGKEDLIGSRTDILYHCFFEDLKDGGGPIDFIKLADQKNKFIVYSYSEPSQEGIFFKTALKYPGKSFYRVKKDFYKEIKKDYPAKWPTTGLQAILHLMGSDFKELHITGFTFFRTDYMSGYTSVNINESEMSRKQQIEKDGSHSFDGELNLFKKYYLKNKYKDIILDSFLCQIIQDTDSNEI